MRIFFIAVLTLFATFALADAEPVLEQYIDWIVENSRFEYNGEPLPEIEYVNQAMLQILMYGEQEVAQAELQGYNLPDVIALYDHVEDTIILSAGTDINDVNNHYMLVHELIHYMQDINGVTDPCPRMLEREAYELTDLWQDEVGDSNPRSDPLFLLMIEMSCLGVF